MRRSFTLLLLLTLACPTFAADRRADKTRLKVATFNAEFLWDGRPPEDGSDSRFPWKGSPDKAEAHMAAIAEVVRALDADVLNLAEVENLAALELFNQRFLEGMGYRAYLADGADTATGQDMGLLTRIDLDTFGRDPRPGHSGGAKKAVSKHYVATLQASGRKIGLVGLHLIAMPADPRRKDDREAQADAIRRMARELAGQGRQVIVLGDFNDLDGETLDARSERPISRVLQMIRGMDPAIPQDDLENAAARLPQERRYTTHADRNGNNRVDRGELSMIDHILLSPALAARLAKVEIRQTANEDLLRVSDHFPVMVTLDLRN